MQRDGITLHRFDDDGRIPNNPSLPLVLYSGALAADAGPASFERTFAGNGWTRSWRNGIFPFHHFHSTAHEVLGIVRGGVSVRLGGERGIATALKAGDIVVIPAGVGHKNEGDSGDLLVVGAYAGGRDWDTLTGEPDERQRVLRSIAEVPLPDADPVHGADGPLLRAWKPRR